MLKEKGDRQVKRIKKERQKKSRWEADGSY